MEATKLESLKRKLNELYGSGALKDKTPVYIDNRNKSNMEEFKMSNNRTLEDAFTYTIQQNLYNAILNGPAVTFKTDDIKKTETPNEADEKWVWVTGYKGLDKDMKAHGDFQYEMDKLYIMPDGEPVKACHGGYHLCLNLKDLSTYKCIGDGNRYFECSALVRESDLNDYGQMETGGLWHWRVDKLAAKSIRLIRELSVDEMLANVEGANEWPMHVKELAVTKNIDEAKKEMKVVTMVGMGYAEPLARYIVKASCGDDGYELAVALDSQTDISMDTKINAIFSHI